MATEAKRNYSEPGYANVENRRKYPFYHANIEHKIPAETKTLLEKYGHVKRDEVSKHVHEIRDRAFDIRAYPCTGLGSWLVPRLCRQPVYHEILQRAKDGATLYGVDIVSHFDVGYDFFRDRESYKGHWIEADFLGDSEELAVLKGRVDIIVVSQVLHQWDWENQVKAAKILSTFSEPGSMVIGNQIGNVQAQELVLKTLPAPVWRHDPESFVRMWREVGEATGTEWEVQAWLRTFPEMGWEAGDAAWMEEGVRLMEFAVKRVV